MLSEVYTFGSVLLLLRRSVDSYIIKQSSSRIVKEGTDIRINCRQEDSRILQIMLWYQHKQSSHSMSLIGYTVRQSQPSYEDQFKDRFQIKRDNSMRGSLIIRKVNPSDSAMYFCTASTQ